LPGIFDIIWKFTKSVEGVTNGYIVAVCQVGVALQGSNIESH